MGSPLLGLTIILLLTIGVFVLGQFFKGKLEWVCYIFLTVGCLFLISILFDPFTKNRIEREGEKQIVGVYRLDTDSSKFENIDLKNYADLILTVKPNNTFIISKQTPFLNIRTGEWNLRDDGDISFIEYQFDNEKFSHQMSPYSYWTFDGLDLKNSKDDDKIIFTRD